MAGTLGGGGQQILKLAHGVRTNRIPHIRREHPLVRALVGKHVEMVEPEIFHHGFKLALAVNRAIELGHGEFGNNSIRTLYFRKLLLRPVRVVVARIRQLRHGGAALLDDFLFVLFLRLASLLAA